MLATSHALRCLALEGAALSWPNAMGGFLVVAVVVAVLAIIIVVVALSFVPRQLWRPDTRRVAISWPSLQGHENKWAEMGFLTQIRLGVEGDNLRDILSPTDPLFAKQDHLEQEPAATRGPREKGWKGSSEERE